MRRITTTDAARAIGRTIRQTSAGPVVLTIRGDDAAVLISFAEARRRGVVCPHDKSVDICSFCSVAAAT